MKDLLISIQNLIGYMLSRDKDELLHFYPLILYFSSMNNFLINVKSIYIVIMIFYRVKSHKEISV